MGDFRDLKVYNKAHKLAIEIHNETLKFPKFEMQELGGQMRRASKSVQLNIAEGYGKNSSRAEFQRYISISLGSCDEVRAQLDICRDLLYIDEEIYDEYEARYVEVGKMLTGLMKNWR